MIRVREYASFSYFILWLLVVVSQKINNNNGGRRRQNHRGDEGFKACSKITSLSLQAAINCFLRQLHIYLYYAVIIIGNTELDVFYYYKIYYSLNHLK